MITDYDVLAEENVQLKTQHSDLNETFGELNADLVKLKNDECLLREQLRLKGDDAHIEKPKLIEELSKLLDSYEYPANNGSKLKREISKIINKLRQQN